MPEPPRAGRELELDLDTGGPERLPDDAILTPQAEDLVARPHDEEVLPLDEEIRPAAAPPPSIPLRPKKRSTPVEAITISDEIEIAASGNSSAKISAARRSCAGLA